VPTYYRNYIIYYQYKKIKSADNECPHPFVIVYSLGKIGKIGETSRSLTMSGVAQGGVSVLRA
jgi:hypothetical protein